MHGELYTILTNKAAKGGKGSIVAIIAGTQTDMVTQVLRKIPDNQRKKVMELTRLAKWREKVRQAGFKAFNTVARSIENHYQTILNYFDNRSTNASAESFNRATDRAKINMTVTGQLRRCTILNLL